MGRVVNVKIDSIEQKVLPVMDGKGNISFQIRTEKHKTQKQDEVKENENGRMDSKRSV